MLMQALVHELRLAAVALQFLTRVPVRLARFEPQWLHDSARHFALVGAAVGLFGAAVLALALLAWPPLVAALLATAATVWLTGGFHEDGLADTCDALGGAVGRERALLIMKDSRLGSYGALGLLLVLGLKAATLAALAGQGAAAAALALLLGHTLSRGATVALLVALPYGGDVEHAKAKPMAQQVGPLGLVVAMAWCAGLVVAVGLLAPWPGPARLGAVLVAVAVVATVCGRWLMRRLGGYTGDGLGATQQFSELAVYLVLAAGLGR